MSTTTPPSRRTLTPAQREQYGTIGFVEVPNVFSPEELVAINDEISRIREETNSGGDDILSLGLRSELTRAFCEDDRIVSLIEDLVYPGIAIYSAKLVEKLPHSAGVCHWHQDDAYYVKHSQSATRMSVWIPLQNCDESNGCVWMMPGSHCRNLQAHRNRPDGTCRFSFEDGHENLEGAVPCPIKAGSILLFHALTWHRSLQNKTDRTRRSFIISYQDALVAGNGDQRKILRAA